MGKLLNAHSPRRGGINIKDKIILDLCGGSGSWSRFYKQNGYDVRVITLPEYDVFTYDPPKEVHGILAAPPCTEFSVLNCIAAPRDRDEASGMAVVEACLRIINQCEKKWWALENPVGHLRKYLGDPKLTFQPWWYGDSWTKHTDIWGDFKLPEREFYSWDDVPDKLPLYIRKERDKPNFAFLHKSAKQMIPQLQWANPQTDADFRVITPPGFAKVFFEANK